MDQSPSEPRDALPRTARFEILERIGAGAMGVVHRARDRETGLDVALKVLRGSDPAELRRLKAEFRALADLVHPNLVRLYELDATVEPSFFTMELVDGVHFDAYVRRAHGSDAATVDPERLAEATWQLALGLAALHRAGRFHRDVKPSNVMVERSGRGVLLDFGLVSGPEDRRGRSSPGFVGTPAYVAPEQAWGLAETPASDWFSVGVLLYECLTGRLPFGRAGAVASAGAPPPPRALAPGTPEALDALVVALLQRTPEARPGEEEILERLRRGPASAPAWLPSRGLPPGAEELVGRRHEMASLRDAFEEATRRGGVSVVVSGPSGIGKSTLIERLAAEVEAGRGAVVLRARCRPQETVRFAAIDGVVDELGRWLSDERPELLAELAPPDLPLLTRAFPVLGAVAWPTTAGAPAQDDPAELRRRAFAALLELLARVAARQPLVIWVDDLQWGDEASAPVLLELMEAPGRRGLLLLLSYRSEDAERHPLLEQVERRSERRVALGPLPAGDSRALVERLLAAADARLAARADEIAAEAGGSPFFLAALARSAALRARGEPVAGRRAPTVETVVAEHLRELAPEARRLLEVVAVAGGSVERSLALRAAELGERGRPFVSALQQECLLRQRARGADPDVEIYHDRIREGVLERIDPPVRRERHRALASVLESTGRADPESLLHHFHGAGELARAGHYAALAAERAADALRFEHAADLYRRAAEWLPADADRLRSLRAKRADALVDAGRCAEAAPLYLEAAQDAPRAEALELRRRAVEQLLVSGRIDDGTRALAPLLRELGLRLPASPRAALAGTAAQLARIALRRTRWRPRAEAEIPPEELTRIDLCYSAARGLLAVDTIRGAYLPCVGLLLALRAGEPGRVGRCLAAVGGGVLAPMPRRLAGWGERMLEEARRIARERGDDYLAGAVAVVTGQACVVRGDWLGAIEHSAEAIRILDGRGRGARWERNIAHTGLLRGLEELGRSRDVSELVGSLLEQARATGDLYGETSASQFAGIADLAAGTPERARERVASVMARWSQEGFHLQHLYALRVETHADLYEGAAARAWTRLARTWPVFGRSVLVRVPVTRIDMLLLRARTALALAEAEPARRGALVASVERDARRLGREGRSDTSAHAALLRAGAAALLGRPERALRHLDAALGAYAEVDMHAMLACVLAGKAGLVRGEEGAALRRGAERAFEHCGVVDPERWRGVYAPGFGARAESKNGQRGTK